MIDSNMSLTILADGLFLILNGLNLWNDLLSTIFLLLGILFILLARHQKISFSLLTISRCLHDSSRSTNNLKLVEMFTSLRQAFSFPHGLILHLFSLYWTYQNSLNRTRAREHSNKSVKRFPAKMETFYRFQFHLQFRFCLVQLAHVIVHGRKIFMGNDSATISRSQFYFPDFKFASSRGFIFRLAPLLFVRWWLSRKNNNRNREMKSFLFYFFSFFQLAAIRRKGTIVLSVRSGVETMTMMVLRTGNGPFENCALHCYLSYYYSKAKFCPTIFNKKRNTKDCFWSRLIFSRLEKNTKATSSPLQHSTT